MKNVIDLKVVKKKFNRCRHNRILINEELSEVECQDCCEKLSPIWVLKMLANKQEAIESRIGTLQEREKKLQGRLRTKCEHCGQFTKINGV